MKIPHSTLSMNDAYQVPAEIVNLVDYLKNLSYRRKMEAMLFREFDALAGKNKDSDVK